VIFSVAPTKFKRESFAFFGSWKTQPEQLFETGWSSGKKVWGIKNTFFVGENQEIDHKNEHFEGKNAQQLFLGNNSSLEDLRWRVDDALLRSPSNERCNYLESEALIIWRRRDGGRKPNENPGKVCLVD